MVQGVVDKWVLGKGFGFIKAGEDTYWVHHSAIEGGNRLAEGEEVEFEVGEGVRKRVNQKNALKVTGPAVRAHKEGSLEGKVKNWKPEYGYGFISHEAEGEVYVHFSAFGGGRLEPGKDVKFDMEDVGHKTGRKVATNVSGDGVVARGEYHGVVKHWNWKGNGFIQPDDETDVVFVHVSEVGVRGGHLAEGKEVYFDIETKTENDKERKLAVNVTGPAVHGEEVYVGGKGGRGGYPVMGFGRGGGGRGAGGYRPPVAEATKAKRKEAAKEGRRVIIGNLPWSCTWQSLKDHFKPAGTVEHADIFYDYATGQSKGVGVVEFATTDEAQKAIAELNHSELRGREIWVREDRDGGNN